MKLSNNAKKSTKTKKINYKVWVVRGLAILLAALFVITGLATVLPMF